MTVSRYLLAASGTNTFLYDLLLLQTAAALPALPRPAKSMATFGTAAIIIDEVGATTLDLSDGSLVDLPAPDGGTFAEIRGRRAVQRARRVGVRGRRHAHHRRGDAARVRGHDRRHHLVRGAKHATARGVRSVHRRTRRVRVRRRGDGGLGRDPGARRVGRHDAPPTRRSEVTSCGATALDSSHVLVVGGVGTTASPTAIAGARVIDLACTTGCTPMPWQGTLPLVRAEAMMLAADAALVSGDDATGATHVFRVTPTGSTEIALREARKGARLFALPISGMAGIIGGGSSVEQYLE